MSASRRRVRPDDGYDRGNRFARAAHLPVKIGVKAALRKPAQAMAERLLIRCSVCGATNRVPPEKLRQGEQPICGRYKTPLSADGKPVTVTDQTFPNEVERSPVPVVVDMWAPWCGPCRYLTPIVEELSAQLAGRVRVAKLNVDENPDGLAFPHTEYSCPADIQRRA
jgi:thiol-disulfide isomerase/thioredoxin